MRRKLLEDLVAWQSKDGRFPLLLKGARQVGKTWLLTEFGRSYFDDVLYINFENAATLEELFAGVIEPQRIIDLLGHYMARRLFPEERY